MKNPSAAWYIRQVEGRRRQEIASALEVVAQQFEALKGISDSAGSDVAPLMDWVGKPKRLKARTKMLRGAVLQALAVLAETQAQLGRLEQIAEAIDD